MQPGDRFHYDKTPGVRWLVEYVSTLDQPLVTMAAAALEAGGSILVQVVDGPFRGIRFLADPAQLIPVTTAIPVELMAPPTLPPPSASASEQLPPSPPSPPPD